MTETSSPPKTLASPHEPSTVFAGKAWYWIPIAPLVAADLWSKAAVFGWLTELHPGGRSGSLAASEEVWSGWLSFSLVKWYNTGTIWGLFQDFNKALVVLRFIALAVLVYFVARTSRRAWFQQLVLGLITAGAIGNLFDNLTTVDDAVTPLMDETGAVRDFLLFRFGDWPFPAFNVADSCITVGAISLVFLLWRGDRAR